MAEVRTIRTGIAGLDEILQGGIPHGNLILVEGAVGTGKTLLGLEFIYRGITEFDEPGVVVLFETSPQKLIRDTACFGWDFEALERNGLVKFIFTSPQVLNQELRSPDSLLLETVAAIGAHRVFVDGISLLQTAATGSNGSGGLASYREVLQLLAEAFQRENLTAMLSHELLAVQEQAVALEVSEYLADTVIVLKRDYRRRGMFRTLEVKKSRGQGYDTGLHTLRIADGEGLQLFRRVQARSRDVEVRTQPTSTVQRSAVGFGPLDDLMGGGLIAGSTTMVVGASGIGKSIFGVQLLVEGARQQGKRGLLVSMDEHPAQIVRNAGLVGLDLAAHVDLRHGADPLRESPGAGDRHPLRSHHSRHRGARYRPTGHRQHDQLQLGGAGPADVPRLLPCAGGLQQATADDDVLQLREPRAVRHVELHAGFPDRHPDGQHHPAELRRAG